MALAANLDLARNHVKRPFLMLAWKRQDAAGLQPYLGEDRVPQRGDRRAQTVHGAGDDAQCQAVVARLRNIGRRRVGKTRPGLFVLDWQRDPQLQAVQWLAAVAVI